MLSCINWQELTEFEKRRLLSRPVQKQTLQQQVGEIIQCVKEEGDTALKRFSLAFDGVGIDELAVSNNELQSASIDEQAYAAITVAINNIQAYHLSCKPEPSTISSTDGVMIERTYRPINKVGLYIPGGNNTPLISSLLMQAIPAKIAGCPQIVLCTPPNRQGLIDAHLLVAARLCGVNKIYRIGGAQAIAAMAYGTESIIKADKLFGPGNAYVTEAKTQVSIDPAGAAIDMPAGPSEVMIVADAFANAEFVAADLLAQAEHGEDSQVLLLCDDPEFAKAVQQAIEKQFCYLSRQSIISKSLAQSAIILCESKKEQLAIINRYAPEHLIINCQKPADWVKDIECAGTLFLGAWAAESLGDYVTGSNHVLPTNGYARNHSGLSTVDFMKAITVQSVNEKGMLALGNAAMTLAQIEGLDAHANAINVRLAALEGYHVNS